MLTNAFTNLTNRWRYSGKEEQGAIDSSLPLIDYGARMYDPVIARWMSVDPLAEKYYSMTPYGYCAGNPVNMIDLDGQKIKIQESNEANKYSFIDYSLGMDYNGDNPFTKMMTDYLNAVYENGGEKVLKELSETGWVITIINETGNKVAPFLGITKTGKGVIWAGALSNESFDTSLGVEAIAHEVFHALQQLKGQGGASVFNEVEAFAFGSIIYNNYTRSLGTMFQNSISGTGSETSPQGEKYAEAFSRITSSRTNYAENLNDAMTFFLEGSRVNMTGLYNDHALRLKNQKRYLLYEYYPR